MSQAQVSYSCGSCGYPLNLSSSNRLTAESGIGSNYRKSIKKGLISFLTVDLSRFTQVDEVNCFPVSWGRYRSKTKLLCRKCGVHIGYGYGDSSVLCAFTLVVPIWVHRATRFRLVPLGITDHGLYMAATGCPSLQVISLYRCQITDFGLGNLDKSCSVLKDVNLLYCYFISDCGLKALSQGCRQLQAVKISHCKGITGVGFKGSSSTLAYVEAESYKLEPLNCRNGLAAIGRGFAFRLKILNLRLCRTFGDMSIVAIAEGCPLLHCVMRSKLWDGLLSG
ncbi:hypothetical protein C1H46_004946 [Malus baccata]|uniref:F-box/LRR-repeat protein 15-like leucin rich repeat domain-containing protein n=1 Tax=Malus baccata TaxID=106549 RepID=A0A540NFR7_MALBA|nr:hypothetical protein C1H46_004946 [Malus baccata]